MLSLFIIHHGGKWGSACIDVQRAANSFEAVCAHRRYFPAHTGELSLCNPSRSIISVCKLAVDQGSGV